MLDESVKQPTLDERIVLALETCLGPSVPHDFAAHVVARVPVRKPISLRASHYGRNIMLISVVALLVLLLAFSHPHHSAIETAIEWYLCAQFIAFAVWLGVQQWDAD